jgi:hypothetical protein
MNTEFYIKQPNEKEIKEDYFCLLGNEDFLDDDKAPRISTLSDKVMAKKVKISDKQNKFYIRMGFDQRLYNPKNSLNSSKNYIELNRNSELFKFKLVNELTFTYYVKYLSTNNNIWLIKAEREIV